MKHSKITPLIFSCIILATGLLLFVAPIPNTLFLKQAAHARLGKAPVLIVGPSTIDYVSNCDTDKRNIPDMLRALTGREVE